MGGPVPGEERHPPPADLADVHVTRRRPERRVDRHLLDVVEEGVEAGAAEDPDLGCQADLASDLLLLDFESLDLVSLDFDDELSDDEDDDSDFLGRESVL